MFVFLKDTTYFLTRDDKGIWTKQWHGICSLCIDRTSVPPKKSRILFSISKHGEEDFYVFVYAAFWHNLSFHKGCVQTEDVLNELRRPCLVMSHIVLGFSREAGIGCGIKCNSQWKMRTQKPKLSTFWLPGTPHGKISVFNIGTKTIEKVGSKFLYLRTFKKSQIGKRGTGSGSSYSRSHRSNPTRVQQAAAAEWSQSTFRFVLTETAKEMLALMFLRTKSCAES